MVIARYTPWFEIAVAASAALGLVTAARRPAATPRPIALACAKAPARPTIANPEPLVRPPVPDDLAPALLSLPVPATVPSIDLPRANIVTNHGTIHCALFKGIAPRTVANFIGLANGTKPWRDPVT